MMDTSNSMNNAFRMSAEYIKSISIGFFSYFKGTILILILMKFHV